MTPRLWGLIVTIVVLLPTSGCRVGEGWPSPPRGMHLTFGTPARRFHGRADDRETVRRQFRAEAVGTPRWR